MATRSCSAALLLSCFGCDDAPAEPAAPPRTAAPSQSRDLHWEAPPAWELEKDAASGNYRARYSIPMQGDAKLAAELLVQRFSGPGKLAEERDYLVKLFEKTDGPKQESDRVGDFDVTWTEIQGDYKFPMGPPMGKKRKHSAHVIKSDWRAVIAMVSTKQRGHWFFRMVGPNDTVQAARSAFRSMIATLKAE